MAIILVKNVPVALADALKCYTSLKVLCLEAITIILL